MKTWLRAVAVITLAASYAVAAPPEQSKPNGAAGGMPPTFAMRFGEKLALTEAQKDQITAIEKTTREQNATFFAASRQLMADMRAAHEANDSAKIAALQPKLDENRKQMKTIRDAQLAKISAVLTPAQNTQLTAIRAEQEARRPEHPPHE